MLTGLLVTRLRLTQLLDDHPEIADEPIAAPIVILGLPRTGTTHLHNLLAQGPGLRSLPYWESLDPIPEPRHRRVAPESDPRRRRCKQALRFQHWMMPLFPAMHEMTADACHEEIQLLAVDFSTMLFEASYQVPSYRDWYVGADQTEAYRTLKLLLQALQWLRGPRRPALTIASAGGAIYGAAKAAKGAYDAQKEAQRNREISAVKYASPLVHQQRLRAMNMGPKQPAEVHTPVKISAGKPTVKRGTSEFGSAFASARKSGKSEFEFKGKKYHTKLKSEVVSVKPAPAAKKAPSVFNPNQDISNIDFAGPPEFKDGAPAKSKVGGFESFLRKHHPKFGKR